MKALTTEKKTESTTYNRTKSDQDSAGHKHEVGPDFVGSGYHPPERFVPLLAKFSHPANATQQVQLFNQLQMHYGNRYVQRVVSAYKSGNVEGDESKLASEIISKKGSGRPLEPVNQTVPSLFKSGVIQAKLKISQPDDEYEREADRVAEELMRESHSQQNYESRNVQAISQIARKEHSGLEVAPEIEAAIQRKRGGHPLPVTNQAFFEQRFGFDFGQVRVHTDAEADRLNRVLSARAFTTGQDIFFRQGEYESVSPSGQELLVHELTHVFQQMGTKRAESIIQREVSESSSDCPQRVDGEVEASRTSPFRLTELPDRGIYTRTWLVYDFAIGSPEFLPEKVADFEALVAPIVSRLGAPFTHGSRLLTRYLRVYGYADCTGGSDVNTSLRLGRADAFWGLFPMQNRISRIEGRPVGTYIESNATTLGRARNRSVRIEEVLRESPPQTRTQEEIEQERGRSRSELPDYISRARQRIQSYPGISPVQKRRIRGFLRRVSNSGFRGKYLTGRLAQNYYAQNLYRLSPSEIAYDLEPTLVDNITHSLSFDHFMDRLVSLDVTISESVRTANRIYNFQGQDNAAAARLAEWIRTQQNDRNSVYNFYR